MEITKVRGGREGGSRKGYRVWGINDLVATCMNMDEFHNIIKSERSHIFLKEYNYMISTI